MDGGTEATCDLVVSQEMYDDCTSTENATFEDSDGTACTSATTSEPELGGSDVRPVEQSCRHCTEGLSGHIPVMYTRRWRLKDP